MTKSRFLLVCSVAMFAFLACTQPAVAQSAARFHVKAVPSKHAEVRENVNPAPPDDLYALEAAFTATSFLFPANSDTTFIWPCFGDTSTPNPDCMTIGDPSQTFPTGGVAVGAPAYVWSLADCDGTTNGSSVGGSPTYIPCGETETWYEDDSNDSTDDLLYIVEVEQGTKVIYDSGTIDFGTNPFAGGTPPFDVVFSGPTNFGTLGVAGENNGNCEPDAGYPTATDPGATPFIIQANKTCVDPAPGLATITVTTELATPKYSTKKTTVAACKPAAPPCYAVTYTKKYSISQKWNIWLQ